MSLRTYLSRRWNSRKAHMLAVRFHVVNFSVLLLFSGLCAFGKGPPYSTSRRIRKTETTSTITG